MKVTSKCQTKCSDNNKHLLGSFKVKIDRGHNFNAHLVDLIGWLMGLFAVRGLCPIGGNTLPLVRFSPVLSLGDTLFIGRGDLLPVSLVIVTVTGRDCCGPGVAADSFPSLVVVCGTGRPFSWSPSVFSCLLFYKGGSHTRD